MKFKILLLIITLLGIFITTVFLSDFFLDKKETHVFDKYSVIEINGEYNLMHGSNFINTGYVSKYTASPVAQSL